MKPAGDRGCCINERLKPDAFVKSQDLGFPVIPAKAGIQCFQEVLDPGFRRGDAMEDFLRDHQSLIRKKYKIKPQARQGQMVGSNKRPVAERRGQSRPVCLT
jgi:hypothetical protein